MTTTPTRRRVVSGAAWAVPTVVVGGVAPAAAASGPCGTASVPLTGGTRSVLASTPNPYVTLWGSSGGAATLPTTLQYRQPITLSNGQVVTMTVVSKLIDTNSNDEQAHDGSAL